MSKLISLSTMKPVQVPDCKIGQIVKYTGDMANSSGVGAIINIRESQYQRYDVALVDGREFRATMLDDSRWIISNEFVDADKLQILRAGVDAKKAADQAQATAKAEQFKLAVEAVKKAYPHLIQGTDPTIAAKNIRIELKRAYPKIKFTVRTSKYSGGDSIDVSWTDGPTVDQVKKITGKYKGGSFDGMNDCYDYRVSPFTTVFGDSKYIFERREFSDKMLASVIGRVCRHYGGLDTIPTVEDYRAGKLWHLHNSGGCDMGRAISDALNRHTYSIAQC